MRVPPAVRVLLALAFGLALGITVNLSGAPFLRSAASVIEPIGALWVNSIRMTVIPLIVSLLVTGIAGDVRPGRAATLVVRSVVLFLIFAAASSLLAGIAAPPLIASLHVDPAAAASLRSQTASVAAAAPLPGFRNWLVELVPVNPIKALADGAVLPVVIATAAFALALGRVESSKREVALDFFTAIRDASFVLIGWIMAVAPIGVFAVALTVAAKLGVDSARALSLFLVGVCGLITLAMLALYPLVKVFAGIPVREFFRACAPAQAVAFSTRSSAAALPAMVESAKRLGIPTEVSGIVLPLAVSIFKFASPILRIAGTLLVARLYGIELEGFDVPVICASIGLLSFYSPGIPSGGLFVMTPLYVALGLPVEGIGLLIALDLIPDMFLTTANVTADLTVTALLSDRRGALSDPSAV